LVIVSSKGKKTKKQNKQTNRKNKQKTKTKLNKNRKFKWNLNPSASNSSSVIVSSKEEKKRKKRVWIQLCEWLSRAAAHLPAAVSLLLLEALLIADLRNELNTHLAPQALFI
jgi:hypothetical protein